MSLTKDAEEVREKVTAWYRSISKDIDVYSMVNPDRLDQYCEAFGQWKMYQRQYKGYADIVNSLDREDLMAMVTFGKMMNKQVHICNEIADSLLLTPKSLYQIGVFGTKKEAENSVESFMEDL